MGGLFGSLEEHRHLEEFGEPLDSQGEGVLSAATRRLRALRNLTGDSNFTLAQFTALSGVTPGTVTASKAIVVDANKDITAFRNVFLINLDAGSSGAAGTVDIFPTTAAKGKLALTAADSAGDTATTNVNASQAGARTYTIPDAGASASFVMTAGAQTIGGAKSFSSNIVPTAGIAAAGGFSVSPRLWASGDNPALNSTDGTDATPVATEVYIAEVFVDANVSLTGVAAFNGSVASGNYKVGLADSTGAILATSVSTAMSGTDTYQRVAFTAPYAAVGPATYYILQFVDNNTARINTHTVGNFGTAKQTGQTYATGFTAITPPTTFTTALGPIASLY